MFCRSRENQHYDRDGCDMTSGRKPDMIIQKTQHFHFLKATVTDLIPALSIRIKFFFDLITRGLQRKVRGVVSDVKENGEVCPSKLLKSTA